MGRWSQYRHRGRGGSAPASAFPLAPPDGESFTTSGVDSNLSFDNFAGCVAGADNFLVRWANNATPTGGGSDQGGCGASGLLEEGAVPDDVWQVQFRWSNDGNPVSDWSNSFPTVIGAP